MSNLWPYGEVCLQDAIPELFEKLPRLFNPIYQAYKWFNLLMSSDMQKLQKKGSIAFEDAIALIHEKCEEQNKTLVIRDWSHLDFTAVPFLQKPSYKPLTAQVLSNKFAIMNTATVRHPIDQWLSLRNLKLLHGKISLEELLRGYLRFAEHCGEIGFIRYEDFTKSPEKEMKLLCQRLSIHYDPTFIQNWCEYTTITGDKNSLRGYRREIKPVPRRSMEDGLIEQFKKILTTLKVSKSLVTGISYKNRDNILLITWLCRWHCDY